MRLSDIFRKINDKTAGETVPAPVPAQAPLPSQQPPVPQQQQPAEIPSVMRRETTPPRTVASAAAAAVSAEAAYTKALVELKNIITCIEKNLPFTDSVTSVPDLSALIAADNDELVSLADRATPDVYLCSHAANDCIYTLLIGRTMGLDGTRLDILGYCALLHDLGMLKYLPLALKNGKLSSAEFEQIKKHPLFGKEIVRLMPGLPENVKEILPEVIEQVHERADGYGYPSGKTLDDIHLYARIIAVADVYEALTHPRSYRERYLPHDALKIMVNTADNAFDTSILKAFLEQISLYPPGSYVRLNTEEIGRVTGTNSGMPTRPRVKIVLDAHLQRISELRVVDLNKMPMLFIKDAVDETKLAITDKKLLLELRARRWWVRGI
jgi:HD-GYP domain-containing protein (c-di-GMP phosphodiesterase class II)